MLILPFLKIPLSHFETKGTTLLPIKLEENMFTSFIEMIVAMLFYILYIYILYIYSRYMYIKLVKCNYLSVNSIKRRKCVLKHNSNLKGNSV